MPDNGRFLLRPHDVNAYDESTFLPFVGSRFRALPSGLIVPEVYTEERPVFPIDQMKTYVTPTDVFGYSPDPSHISRILGSTSFETTLVFVAELFRHLDDPSITMAQVDEFYIAKYIAPAAQAKYRGLVRAKNRAIVAPQLLFVLLKLSGALSATDLQPGESDGSLGIPLLLLADQVNLGDSATIGVGLAEPSTIERFLVSAGHFYNEADIIHTVGRFMAQWFDPPERVRGHPRFIDIKEAYVERVGVPLEDVIALAFTLYSRCISGSPFITKDYIDQLGWEQDRLAAVLELFTCSREYLQDELKAQPVDALEWDISIFERFPVVRLDENRLVVVRPKLLLKRAFGFLPLWDLRSALSGRANRTLRGKIDVAIALVGEDYVLSHIKAIARREEASYFGEDDLIPRLGGDKGRTCDAVILNGTNCCLFEATGSQLRRESVAGTSGELLSGDLDKLTGKVEQLDATIESIRANPSAIGEELGTVREFFPVLVLTEGFPVNPITLSSVRQRVRDAGLLRGDGVRELEILDCVDLEMIEGVEELPRPRLATLFADKQASSMQFAGTRDYLILSRRSPVRKPQRVIDSWQSAIRLAVEAGPSGAEMEAVLEELMRDED